MELKSNSSASRIVIFKQSPLTTCAELEKFLEYISKLWQLDHLFSMLSTTIPVNLEFVGKDMNVDSPLGIKRD